MTTCTATVAPPTLRTMRIRMTGAHHRNLAVGSVDVLVTPRGASTIRRTYRALRARTDGEVAARADVLALLLVGRMSSAVERAVRS